LFAPQNFAQALPFISLGRTVIPRRNNKERLCKVLVGKQGVLWEMYKWRNIELCAYILDPFYESVASVKAL